MRIKHLQELGGEDLVVLPGIELRTELGGSEKIHIIGLFPENADLNHVWTTLQGQLGLTEADIKAKGDDKIYVLFRQAADLIHKLGGLVSVHAGKKSNSIENISNAPAFKQAVKEDLAKACVDILELGRPEDAADYEKIVFPSIGQAFPMVIGSDNHDASQYTLKIPNWIRCDPTFEGLKQILHEPTDRVYRGEMPPMLKRVAENKTKYISDIAISKLAGSTLIETWFNSSLPINPGLVAIIGNKGSGKSALSDTLGLLGETRHSASFSFLNTGKFRQPKNNTARHFRARLTWENGTNTEKGLDDEVDTTAVETIKYIPQNYLETVCNELRGGGESRFDAELKGVIFSHVQQADRLHAESLDELIEYKTAETYDAISLLRSELTETNRQIAASEAMLFPSHKKGLEAQLEEKRRELAAHDVGKPEQVSKPELDPAKQSEMSAVAQLIEGLQASLSNLYQKRSELQDEQKLLTRKAAAATKLSGKIENFRKQYQLFQDSGPEFTELGLVMDEVVRVTIDTTRLTATQNTISARDTAIKGELDAKTLDGIAAKIVLGESALGQERAKLDAPNQEYQNFLLALEEWQGKRTAIVGDKETVDSLAYFEDRLKNLETIPAQLESAREQRKVKAKEILDQIQSLADLYQALYKPVHDFIERHPLAKEGFQLDFRVSIVNAGLQEGFFELVSQQKKGSFCGVEEGRQVLRTLLEKTDWNSSDSVFGFLEEILLRLSRDFRLDKHPEVRLPDQLKKDTPVEGLYDYLFSFGYLRPKYQLQWGGRDLDELSPGERGTVLLLFYLLVDSSNIPLVIDQPEENLDNQTVFSILVPAVKEARTRRQIMMVTHNPNLAVVCDADQVIYAHIDKKDGNKVTYECGAIENPTINRRIIDVLEGTRPAFDNRDAKYQQRPKP